MNAQTPTPGDPAPADPPRGTRTRRFAAAAILALTLTAVIAPHEAGHALAARALGIGVDAFSVGFGPAVARWRIGETEYRLGAIPVGGYAKIRGKGALPLSGDLGALYEARPLWQRALVVGAGTLANYIFAAALYLGLLVAGIPGGPQGQTRRERPATAARLALQTTLGHAWRVFATTTRLVWPRRPNPSGPATRVQVDGLWELAHTARRSLGTHPRLYLVFLASLSAQFGSFNLLPIPFLDGGTLVFLVYELVAGQRPNPIVTGTATLAGLLLVAALIAWSALRRRRAPGT